MYSHLNNTPTLISICQGHFVDTSPANTHPIPIIHSLKLAANIAAFGACIWSCIWSWQACWIHLGLFHIIVLSLYSYFIFLPWPHWVPQCLGYEEGREGSRERERNAIWIMRESQHSSLQYRFVEAICDWICASYMSDQSLCFAMFTLICLIPVLL